MAKYEVTMRMGKLKPGQIVNDDNRYVRRKLKEQKNNGDCLKLIEEKMIEKKHENKMMNKKYEDKGES